MDFECRRDFKYVIFVNVPKLRYESVINDLVNNLKESFPFHFSNTPKDSHYVEGE